MRQLPEALLEEQRKPTRQPAVKLEVQDYGHPQASSCIQWQHLSWQRIHSNTAPRYYHGCCVTGNGTLIRLLNNGVPILVQRTLNPGSANPTFQNWVQIGSGPSSMPWQCAIASHGSQVMVVAMSTTNLMRIESNDHGATWGSWVTMTNARPCERGCAIAYKPNGDCAIVHASDVTTVKALYVQTRTNGVWSSGTGQRLGQFEIYWLSMYYDGDWNIIAVVLQERYLRLVRMIYGDGNKVSAGQWGTDQNLGLASARIDFSLEYQMRRQLGTGRTIVRRGVVVQQGLGRGLTWWERNAAVMRAMMGETVDMSGPFVHKPSGYRALLSVSRQNEPWVFAMQPGTEFIDGRWGTAVTIPTCSPWGMALASDSSYIYATQADEIWRAEVPSFWQPPTPGGGAGSKITIPSSRIVRIIQDETAHQPSQLTVDLDNSDGYFNNPGSGTLSVLKRGSRVNLHIGYKTPEGEKLSEAGRYFIDSFEYRRNPNTSAFTIHCVDAWGLLYAYEFDRPVEWNITADQYNCYQLIEQVVQAVGGTLTYKSRSSVITSLYPRMEVRPGENAASVLNRLLSLVPDVVYFFGLQGVIVYPLPTDSPVYGYKFP